MRDLITIMGQRFSGLLRGHRTSQEVSCNYGDNYYGDKKCCPGRK